MFMGGSIQQWHEVITYMVFMVILFNGIYLVSVKLSNYYFQEIDRRKKFNQLRKNYHCHYTEKNYYKKVG